MIEHELLEPDGVLVVRPKEKLEAEDFVALAALVDPYLEAHGKLAGLLIDAPEFPGWEGFDGLVSHLRFLRDHHRQIAKVAIVSGSPVLSAAPKVAQHFVSAEIKEFPAGDVEAALAWIRSDGE